MAQSVTRQAIREEAADFLGLLVRGVCSGFSTVDKTVIIDQLVRKVPNTEWLLHAFVTFDGVNFARITQQPTSTGLVTLSHNLLGLQIGNPLRIYLLLDVEEWNLLIDRTMTSELYRRVTYSTPIVAGTNEYALPAEIQTRADVIDVHFRDASTGMVWQSEAGIVRYREDGNAVTLLLGDLPAAIANLDLYIEYKKRYAALADDAATTTCPYDLAWSTVATNAVGRLQAKFGEAYSQKLQRQYNDALRMMLKLKQMHMPPVQARDYTYDVPNSPDIPSVIYDGGGW